MLGTILLVGTVIGAVVLLGCICCYKYTKAAKAAISLATIIVAIVAVIGGFWIPKQMQAAREFKRYDNYLHFNEVYNTWYYSMPESIKNNYKADFSDLEEHGKAWVRRYFNLYSQEYFFHKKEMIPEEMWKTIHGCGKAAFQNMKRYPALREGYYYWKGKGAFNFPDDFSSMLEEKLKECDRI